MNGERLFKEFNRYMRDEGSASKIIKIWTWVWFR
jgi:hypothetical protein